MLVRLWMIGWLFISCVTVSSAVGQQDTEPAASAAEKLQQSPNDTELMRSYVTQRLQAVFRQMGSNPDEARSILNQLEAELDKVQPTTAEAKQLLAGGRSAIGMYRQRVDLAQTTLASLKERLEKSPGDREALTLFERKVIEEVGPIVSSEPARAEEQYTSAKSFLAALREQTEDAEATQQLDRALQSLSRLERNIEAAKKLEALVGQPAAPLDIETWANGRPLTAGDLKGKVVLLDFWAVWCGPCIATFPHLREWHEQYSDRGLVIIGLTRYYNYEWDEAAGRAKRSRGTVEPEQELQMLARFAEQHELKHPFAIQQDSQLAEYYGVTGIPHVVVIDQQGVVRLIRVGSGDQNAKDIEGMLRKLLDDEGA